MKATKKIVCVILLVAILLIPAIFTFAACDRGDGQTVDKTKTTVRLKYYAGGMGTAWMDAAISAFETKYADYSFEKGKTGVQVLKDYTKSIDSAEVVKGSKNNIYITEGTDYYNFISKGIMMDITDVVTGSAVTGPDSSESVTIESKLSDSRKNFYNVGTGSETKYYALPYYETSVSLIYNVDLFDTNGWYFIDGKSADDLTEAELEDDEAVYSLFLESDQTGTATKSAGPDGVKGTSDDGLPATYKDFQALLKIIKWSGYYTFISNSSTDYMTPCATEIWATASGLEEMALSMSFEGTSNTLVDLDANGNLQYDDDGNVKLLGATTITPSNAYLIHQQKGKLDAIEFVKMMMNSNYYSDTFSPSFSHTMAQRTFINGTSDNKQVAMLIEGSWWNSEARSQYNSEEDRMTKKFAVMPIPKPDASQIGQNTVRISERRSVMFINSTCPQNVLPAVKAFLSYLQSDEAMTLFSVNTDALRAMNYEISEEDLAKMTYYGRSNYETSRAATTDWLEWVPTTDTTKLKTEMLNSSKWGFNNGKTGSAPFQYFKDNPTVTTINYFNLILNNYKSSWSIK